MTDDLYLTGYFCSESKPFDPSPVHIVTAIDNKPICGVRYTKRSFLWCSHGAYLRHVTCGKCLDAYSRISVTEKEVIAYYTVTMSVPRDKKDRQDLVKELLLLADKGELGEDFDFVFSVKKDDWTEIAKLAHKYVTNASVIREEKK